MCRAHVFVRWSCALLLLALCVALQPIAFAASASADARFDALSKRFVDEFGRYSPVSATQLGDHRFDRELDDLSASGRARTLAWTKGVLGELQAIDRSRLSRANQVDAAMLDNQLRYSIWSRKVTATGRGTRSSIRSWPDSRCTDCWRASSRRCPNACAR